MPSLRKIARECTVDHRRPARPSSRAEAEYREMLAASGDPGHDLDVETPPEVLAGDARPWWETMPASPELDTPVRLPAAEQWLLEGRGVAGRTSRRLRDDDAEHYRHLFR